MQFRDKHFAVAHYVKCNIEHNGNLHDERKRSLSEMYCLLSDKTAYS